MAKRKKDNTLSYVLKDKKGNPLEIPVEGSLGLLATGYKGVMLWREKRKEMRKKKQSKEKA